VLSAHGLPGNREHQLQCARRADRLHARRRLPVLHVHAHGCAGAWKSPAPARRAAADARRCGTPSAVQAGLRLLLMTIRELACFQRVNWSPDSGELRRFAVAMLAGFAVLGLFRTLRHHGLDMGVFVLWGIGVALALAAMLPKLGRAAYLGVYVPTSLLGY